MIKLLKIYRPIIILMFILLSACVPGAQEPSPTLPPASTGWQIITPRPTRTATLTPTEAITWEPTLSPVHTDTQIPNTPTQIMLTPTPSSTGRCEIENGEMRLDGFRSEILGRQLDFYIYLPPCYGLDPDRRYPVLYLLHGLYANYTQWDNIGLNERADVLISTGEIEPFIVVMPGETNFLILDATPFDDAIMTELIPFVDRKYLTIPEKETRAIGGLSRGAAWAMRIGINNYQSFSAIGAHSLPIVLTESQRLLRLLAEMPAEEQPRLFLDIGDKDPELQYTQEFEQRLTDANIPHVWYLFLGRHEEAYWQKHVDVYLRWYAQTWE